MTKDLFKADSLDELADGLTNVPLALHNGTISADAIEKILNWDPKQRFVDYIHYYATGQYGVVRVNADTRSLDYFNDGSTNSYWHHRFSLDGSHLSSEKGRKFHDLDTLASVFTLGIYAVVRNFLPSVQANAKQFSRIEKAAAHARSENLTEVKSVLNSVEVYLGNAEDVNKLTGKQVSLVSLLGPQQFIEGVSQAVLQVWTYMHGGNGLVDYQRASPARATPVILS